MATPVQQIEKLIDEGRFLEARRCAEPLLKDTTDGRLQQLLALAMAKSGAPKAAMALLEPLYKEHPDDPETSGILGSIYKELFKETKNPKYGVLSRDTYLNNFRLTRNYYTGINAASMYAMSGSMAKAKEIARELVPLLNTASENPWELASLAEALLLLREKEKAVEVYLRCRHLIGSDWGKVSSVYNQLWLLNHYIPVSSQMMDTFSPPAVAAFVGHMIDHPARTLQRFPPSIEHEIKQALRGCIQSLNARIGYSSLACGGDILFAESMAETGGEVNLFLPFADDDFLNSSVRYAGQHWVDRFENLKKKFPVTYLTTEPYGSTDELFTFQTRVIFGAAVQRAVMLHSFPRLITVYSDSDFVSKKGGTYDTLKYWPENEKRTNINPQHFIKSSHDKAPDVVSETAPHDLRAYNDRHIRFLLSVTMGYSSSDSHELPEEINEKIHEWGVRDFDGPANSILFAFESVDESAAAAWHLANIKRLSPFLKISLHAGPVHIKSESSRIAGEAADIARRINTFSAAGKIYSSFAYASVLALHGDRYAVEYAGALSLDAGTSMPIFQLNRHADVFDV